MSPEGIAHRYARGGVSIDVLAPEGLGPRTNLTTTPPGRTLQVSGGTQALDRTELVPVKASGRHGMVPRPSLLGAIISKAVSVDVDDLPEAQRLRSRTEMADTDHQTWKGIPDDDADRGRAVLRLLTR